jgi:sec-independent protein translocase protein TatA
MLDTCSTEAARDGPHRAGFRRGDITMPNLGAPELIIIAVVLIALFGWKKLPDMARSLGRSARVFKSEVDELKKDGKSAPSEASQSTVQGEAYDADAERRAADRRDAEARVADAERRAAEARAEADRLRASGQPSSPTGSPTGSTGSSASTESDIRRDTTL